MTGSLRVLAALTALVIAAGSLTALYPVAASAAPPPSERYQGEDRYATSARISAASFAPGVSVAYVASGAVFADALSGAAAAGHQSSPVLLTRPDSLPSVIADEITRLQPRSIVVLGGEQAVSADVSTALEELGSGTVSRIAEADRYSTSAAISAAVFTPNSRVAYVASGEAFPDALSAGSVAARDGGPILLTPPWALADSVREELIRLNPARVVVLGGESAVFATVAEQIADATGKPVERRSGADRFETSVAVSAAAFAPGVPTVYIASGVDFPDALSGAAAARGAPLLISAPWGLSDVVARELTRLRPSRIILLGGTSALGDYVRDQVVFAAEHVPEATGGRITTADQVGSGTCLLSADSSHRVCVDPEGGFRVLRGSTQLWSSGPTPGPVRALRVRSDGNLVMLSPTGATVWQSSTAGTSANELVMQNDGDAMLRGSSGNIVWSTLSSDTAPDWSLPFAAGQRWSAGAPHANSGNTVGARGALDFGPLSGGDRRVLTIAPGTVYQLTCGSGSYLGVNHAGGWQSTYYHLVNYQNQLIGQYVPSGTYLGDVGRTVPCGGGATFDHVHLTIRRAGQMVSVEGMLFDGYQVRSDGRDYWGYWTTVSGQRVLTSPGGAACCLTAK